MKKDKTITIHTPDKYGNPCNCNNCYIKRVYGTPENALKFRKKKLI